MLAGQAGYITNFFQRRTPGMSARWSRLHARLYRRTDGRFMPKWFGAPVMALETVGRRSGKPRVSPVLYVRDGDALAISPAAGGTNPNPAWWLNLQAAGEGVAVVGRERWRVRPRVATGDERERLWSKLCDVYPAMHHYVGTLGQELTVIVLERVSSEMARRGSP